MCLFPLILPQLAILQIYCYNECVVERRLAWGVRRNRKWIKSLKNFNKVTVQQYTKYALIFLFQTLPFSHLLLIIIFVCLLSHMNNVYLLFVFVCFREVLFTMWIQHLSNITNALKNLKSISLSVTEISIYQSILVIYILNMLFQK